MSVVGGAYSRHERHAYKLINWMDVCPKLLSWWSRVAHAWSVHHHLLSLPLSLSLSLSPLQRFPSRSSRPVSIFIPRYRGIRGFFPFSLLFLSSSSTDNFSPPIFRIRIIRKLLRFVVPSFELLLYLLAYSFAYQLSRDAFLSIERLGVYVYTYIFSFTPSRILHPSIKLECRSKKNNHNDVFHIPLRNFNTFL